MAISKDAQAVIDSAGAGALSYIQGKGGYGGRLTSGEAKSLLTGFSPTITPQQVYSASNIQQASTNPAPMPNYSDPFALREYFMNTGDIVGAREAARLANQELITARQTGRAQQQAIKELPQALNVIRGEKAVAGEQQNLTEQALAENQLVAQSTYDTFAREADARYGIAQEQRNELRNLITATKGKAGISYGDTYEAALKKAAKYEEKVIKEERKEAEKSELKKLALAAGVKTKGKSSKEIRKALEKKAKKDSDLNDKMNNLKLTAAELEIANTRSIISNRGKENSQTLSVDKSDNGIKSLVDEAINSGENWGDIAATLQGAGINTVRDSIADKYLRYKLNNEFRDKNGKFKP